MFASVSNIAICNTRTFQAVPPNGPQAARGEMTFWAKSPKTRFRGSTLQQERQRELCCNRLHVPVVGEVSGDVKPERKRREAGPGPAPRLPVAANRVQQTRGSSPEKSSGAHGSPWADQGAGSAIPCKQTAAPPPLLSIRIHAEKESHPALFLIGR